MRTHIISIYGIVLKLRLGAEKSLGHFHRSSVSEYYHYPMGEYFYIYFTVHDNYNLGLDVDVLFSFELLTFNLRSVLVRIIGFAFECHIWRLSYKRKQKTLID